MPPGSGRLWYPQQQRQEEAAILRPDGGIAQETDARLLYFPQWLRRRRSRGNARGATATCAGLVANEQIANEHSVFDARGLAA